MNGQHFNSGGSGNGTPTPPFNNSYPASLSSHSSRDPSPHSREFGVLSQYGYSANYDQKMPFNVLSNNFSSVPTDKQQRQQPGVNTQKSQHQFINNASVRSQSQGFMNHTSSTNISSYNSTPTSSPYINSGNKYGVTSMQNSSYTNTGASLFTSPQNNNPNEMLNRNTVQVNKPTFNVALKQNDSQPLISIADIKQSQLPSSPLIAASLSQPVVQNIPSSSSPLTNVNLTNSSSLSFHHTKEQQTGLNNDGLSLRLSSGSVDKLHDAPPTSSSSLFATLQSSNINSTPLSISPRSINNITSTSDSSLSPRNINSPYSPSCTDSSTHSSQESSSSPSTSNSSQSYPLLPSLPPKSAVSLEQNAVSSTYPPSSSMVPSQSLFSASSVPVSSQSHVGSQPEVSAVSTPNQQKFQNQPIDASSQSLNNVEEKTYGEAGSGDRSRESDIKKEVEKVVPTPHLPQHQQVMYSQPQFQSNFRPPNQSASSMPPVSSFSSVNQIQSANVISHQSGAPNVLSSQSNLSQSSNYHKYPTPPSSASSSVFNSMQTNSSAGIVTQNSFNLHKPPPPNIPGHPPPPQTTIGHQQLVMPSMSGSASCQSMPSATGLYNQKPPVVSSLPRQQIASPTIESHQRTIPTGPESKQPVPKSNLGLHPQIPPSSLGSVHQTTPPSSGIQRPPMPGRHNQAPIDVRKAPSYLQQNQFQQRPPVQNQYPLQNVTPVQSQPVMSAGPYGMSRYPPMPNVHGGACMDNLTNQMRGANITQEGFNRLWGMDTYDLLKTRNILPKERMEAPSIRLNPELFDAENCSPELFRCTLTKIPETKSLLDKSRLPLGVLMHPFKDLTQLSVIQCSMIVRCRACRTYINPFVYFVDNKRWKCNLCFRVNELPDEFQFDPISKTYGDPSRRPEIKSATIEFIAPSEYMVRPPQPAVYLFLFDVSRLGTECGYLEIACQTLLDELDNLPGDARTSVGFITYDSSVHFYSLAEGLNQPHQMVVVDIDDMFLPCPENLLVNLSECHDLIKDLLVQLPKQYTESYDTESALGAALQAAYKLLAPTGGRVTVFQARLPSLGPGTLMARENPSERAGDSVPHLNPCTDFYKKLALDCSSQQIAVDLFIVNSQYVDVATLSGVSKFSGGCMYHFPLFRAINSMQVNSLKRTFQRYLTRKIGFESVMRLRCTRGLSIHTFHGNFFVRSTDLLSLPNVNPDAGFGMQVSIDENLSELQNVCLQAALLYTSSKGERRIRVHTLCLPIATNLSDVLNAADQQCIIGLLAKMAVDRSIESSLTDAREAFVNVVADILTAYKLTQNSGPSSSCLLAPKSLRLIPLYILSLLKSVAFRTGQCTRLDDRVFAMCQMKTLPLSQLLQLIYPELYVVHSLEEQPQMNNGDENPGGIPLQRLHLSSEKVDSHGVYLLDDGTMILIYVGHNINPSLCQNLFGVPHFTALPQDLYEIPELNTPENERLRDVVFALQSEKPFDTCIQIIRDDSPHRGKFLERLIEDKNEAGTSYYEFLQRIKVLMK